MRRSAGQISFFLRKTMSPTRSSSQCIVENSYILPSKYAFCDMDDSFYFSPEEEGANLALLLTIFSGFLSFSRSSINYFFI
jgi:hypothetical protein